MTTTNDDVQRIIDKTGCDQFGEYHGGPGYVPRGDEIYLPTSIEVLTSRAGFDSPTGQGIEANFLTFDIKYPDDHAPFALANFSEAAGVTEGLEGGQMLGWDYAENYAEAFQILLNDATQETLAKFAKFISE